MANTLKFGNGEWYGKKDTILAYNDENRNFKPLPFSFSRESSATVVNKDGLIETVGSGEPRIDYKDDSKGALLLEPTRTNKVIYSEDFNNANWTIENATITENSTISPDGTLNASLMLSTNSNTRISDGIAFSDTFYVSVFVKYIDQQFIQIYSGASGSYYINFDVKNKLYQGGSLVSEVKFEDFGNGWLRLGAKFSGAGTASSTIRLGFSQSLTSDYGTSEGNTSSGSSIYIWGFQLEDDASYATSYIPTSGSAVTRVTDSCSQTVPSGVIGQTEGVVYIDFLSVNNFDSNSGTLFQIKEDNDNRINIYFSNGTPRLFGIEDSIGVFNQALSLTTGSVCKLAIKYNSTSTKVFINGSLSHTLNGINNIAFNDFSFLPSNNINYNEIKLYNKALTDNELKKLTTI